MERTLELDETMERIKSRRTKFTQKKREKKFLLVHVQHLHHRELQALHYCLTFANLQERVCHSLEKKEKECHH